MSDAAEPRAGAPLETRDQDNLDVLVVGAGHNGLTAACYLAKAGLRVLVVEASPLIGGMTTTNPILDGAPGHLVNEGSIQASLFRATPVESELELRKYGLRQVPIEPAFTQFDPDGASIAFWADAERTAAEIRRFSKRDAQAWLELSEVCDAGMDVVIPYLNVNPVRPGLRTVVGMAAKAGRHPRKLAEFGRILTAPMAQVIDERFESPLVRGFLAAVALEPMTRPGSAMDMLFVGLHQRLGSSMFVGGTGALPKALAACLADHGGSVRTSARVRELKVRGGRITGVMLDDGEEIAARSVVTTCSPKTVLTRLLPSGTLPGQLEARARHIPTVGTASGDLKIDIALRGRVDLPRQRKWREDGLDVRKTCATVHTFEQILDAWERVERGLWPDPVPAIAYAPTAVDPSQGPDGQDTFWVWSGAVPARPQDPWEQDRDRIGQQVLSDLGRFFEGLEELEISRSVRAAPDLEERFNAIDGAVYHCDSVLARMGPMRPALGLSGYKTPVEGLYTSGAGTHPSGGICAGPGRLAAQTVISAIRKGT